MTILGILSGAAGVTAGIILARRSRRKAWHILTAAGACVLAASLVLMIGALLLIGGIRNQPPDGNAVYYTDALLGADWNLYQ